LERPHHHLESFLHILSVLLLRQALMAALLDHNAGYGLDLHMDGSLG
jgi:hypothetical protein